MIHNLYTVLDEADLVLHYNGKKFDIPYIQRTLLEHNYIPPSPFHQLDLYLIARSTFSFPSLKLDYISQHLNLGSKHKHEGFDLWKKFMEEDDTAHKTMKEYNIQDVLLVEALYKKVLPWIKTHPSHALYNHEEGTVCTNCGSDRVIKNGIETTLLMAYQRYRCQECGTNLRGRVNVVDKEKKQGMLSKSKL